MGAVSVAMERAVGETGAGDGVANDPPRHGGERFAVSRFARHGLGRDGYVYRRRRSFIGQPRRHGARRFGRAHYHGHGAVRRDSGNVRLQFLVTSIRAITVEMDNFAAELASEFEHKLVDHGYT